MSLNFFLSISPLSYRIYLTMVEKRKVKLGTDSYKGVRDFYPEEMFFQNHIFGVMRKTAESFGYVEYGASILEPAELYRAKTGEEIVNEQTYSFKDRGDREVTLRPEMTPTLARMVAARVRELPLPLRWYSIPNLFRYEQPQRGRLREHWQLNVDLFGIEGEQGDAEVICLASKIMKNLGAKDEDFVIKINDRRVVNELYDFFKIDEEKRNKLSKVIDKKEKISFESFKEAVEVLIPKKADEFLKAISSGKGLVETLGEKNVAVQKITELIDRLSSMGVNNISFEPTLMRGFDYYTGTIFEGFDTDEKNKRSLFGGGRYDELLSIFGNNKVPAVGFGMGDVTTIDFLQTHLILPIYRPTVDLYLCLVDEMTDFGNNISQKMRDEGLNVANDFSDKNIADRIKKATKDSIPYFAVIGKDEEKNNKITIKNLTTREEKQYNLDKAGFEKIFEDLRKNKN
mgnify:CR=1 FL=1